MTSEQAKMKLHGGIRGLEGIQGPQKFSKLASRTPTSTLPPKPKVFPICASSKATDFCLRRQVGRGVNACVGLGRFETHGSDGPVVDQRWGASSKAPNEDLHRVIQFHPFTPQCEG